MSRHRDGDEVPDGDGPGEGLPASPTLGPKQRELGDSEVPTPEEPLHSTEFDLAAFVRDIGAMLDEATRSGRSGNAPSATERSPSARSSERGGQRSA